MTWFWNPCLQEPETERHELFQENRFWEGGRGGGDKPFSGGQHFAGHGFIVGNILVGNILGLQRVQEDLRQGTTAFTGQAKLQFTPIGNHLKVLQKKATTWKILS